LFLGSVHIDATIYEPKQRHNKHKNQSAIETEFYEPHSNSHSPDQSRSRNQNHHTNKHESLPTECYCEPEQER
jgi:hypothetical protein